MASILPRLAVILALLTGTGWAVAGAPVINGLLSPSVPAAPVAVADELTQTGSVIGDIQFIEDATHRNNVLAVNNVDGRFELNGRVDFVRGNDKVTAGNQAVANSNCSNCQTLALALQLVVYPQSATYVAPVNVATAVNENCHDCFSVAWAIQYVIPVADPKDLPLNVKELVKELNAEMNEIERIRQLNEGNVQQIDAQISSILARFDSLRGYLRQDRREAATAAQAATATAVPPTATSIPATPTPVPVATATPLPPTATPVPTATPLPPTAMSIATATP